MSRSLSLLLLTLPLAFTDVQAQTHKWHDLTPDSLRGATFGTVAVGYEGDTRRIYTSYVKQVGFDPATCGLLKSTDSGRSWHHAPLCADHLVTPPENARLVYAIRSDALFKSTDGGQSWTNLTPGLLQASNFAFINGLTRVELSPHDTARVAVAYSSGSGALFLSGDGGRTFRYLNLGVGSDGVRVNVVASSGVEGRLYVPVFRNGAAVSEDFYVLGEWGRTVEAAYKHPQVEVHTEPRGLKIDVNDVLYNYNWVSRDEGRSWTKTAGDGLYYVYTASRNASIAIASGAGRHNTSNDAGLTWEPFEDETPAIAEDEVIDPRDSTLFAGMYRSGIFAYARTGTVGTSMEDEQPTASSLQIRVYPNPFREQATIAVETPSGPTLTVEVFDVIGRRVATLADAVAAVGTLRLQWDGRSAHGLPLGAGVYLVRARSEAGTAVAMTTLLLTKL